MIRRVATGEPLRPSQTAIEEPGVILERSRGGTATRLVHRQQALQKADESTRRPFRHGRELPLLQIPPNPD